MGKMFWFACAVVAAVEAYLLVVGVAGKAILGSDLLAFQRPLLQFALGLTAFSLAVVMIVRAESRRPLHFTRRAVHVGLSGAFVVIMATLVVGVAGATLACFGYVWGSIALMFISGSVLFSGAVRATLLKSCRILWQESW